MPDDVAFVRVLGPIQVVTTSGLALDLPSASQRRCFGDTIVVASQGRYRLGAPVEAALFITLLSQPAGTVGRASRRREASAFIMAPTAVAVRVSLWARGYRRR